MKTKDELDKLIDSIHSERASYLKELFQNCPEFVISAACLVSFRIGDELFRAGKPCDYIYFILSGKVRGIEYQQPGNMYVFMEFTEADILGDYEVFGEIPECRVTIQAVEPCKALAIPANIYVAWMHMDINALYLRIQKIMNTMTHQMSDERKYILLNCRERLILFITEQYRKKGNNKEYKFHMTQPELADRIGVTVRTIQRNLLSLEKEGMIAVKAGKICISADQYQKLNQCVVELLE